MRPSSPSPPVIQPQLGRAASHVAAPAERRDRETWLEQCLATLHLGQDRGQEKTVLREYQCRAEARDAVVVRVTAGEAHGLIAQIADGITRASATWNSSARDSIARSVDSVIVKVGIPGVAEISGTTRSPRTDTEPSGARAFEDLIRSTAKNASGLVIIIDEIQAPIAR